MQRAVGIGRDERQVDLSLLYLAELDLGLLGSFLEALGGHAIVGEIDAVRRLELLDEPIDDALIPVVATKLGVAVGALHFEDAIANLEHAHVERAATEVEHQDGFVFGALIEAVGQGRGGWLVDDAQDLEAGDLAGFFGGGALSIVEVGRDRDDGLGHNIAAIRLGVALELHQRASADLLCGVALAIDVFAAPRGAHLALDAAEGAIWVGDCLTLGNFANEYFAGLTESHHAGGGACALGVGDDDWFARLEEGNDAVGGTEVDSDCLGHDGVLLCSVVL